MPEGWGQFFTILLSLMAICLVVSIVGLLLIMRQIRRLNVPRDADFFTTMRHVPFILVLLLDLLDFGLDVFSAPISWIILDRMGLPNLRNKAALEAIIPITNAIPTFTISWVVARMLNLGDPPGTYDYDAYDRARPRRRSLPERYDERDARRYPPDAQRRRRTIDMEDR